MSPAWLAEWSRKHPSGAAPVRAAAITMCPGTGLLSQNIERGPWRPGSCRRSERARSLATLPVLGAAADAALAADVQVVVACMLASRWYARVRSLRAIAMVAIFFPRLLAMAA